MKIENDYYLKTRIRCVVSSSVLEGYGKILRRHLMANDTYQYDVKFDDGKIINGIPQYAIMAE